MTVVEPTIETGDVPAVKPAPGSGDATKPEGDNASTAQETSTSSQDVEGLTDTSLENTDQEALCAKADGFFKKAIEDQEAICITEVEGCEYCANWGTCVE